MTGAAQRNLTNGELRLSGPFLPGVVPTICAVDDELAAGHPYGEVRIGQTSLVFADAASSRCRDIPVQSVS